MQYITLIVAILAILNMTNAFRARNEFMATDKTCTGNWLIALFPCQTYGSCQYVLDEPLYEIHAACEPYADLFCDEVCQCKI